MPVHDEHVLAHPKFAPDRLDERRIVYQVKVRVLVLLVRVLVRHKVRLKRRQLVLPKQGALGPAPQVPDQVRVPIQPHPLLPQRPAQRGFQHIHQFHAPRLAPFHLQRLQLPGPIHRHARMEEEHIIPPRPHPPAIDQPLHVLAQLHRSRETLPHPIDARLLFGRVRVRILRINRRQIRIQQRMLNAINRHRLLRMIDRVQQPPMREVPLRMAFKHPPLGLELHDRHGLLHPRDRQRIAESLALGRPLLRRVVAIHITHQPLDRRHDDAIPLLKLAQPPIPQAESQRGQHARLVPQVTADPQHVVIAPDHVALGLPHQRLNHAIDPRPAIAQVPQHQQFITRQVANQPRTRPHRAPIPVILRKRGDHLADVRRPLPAAKLNEQLPIPLGQQFLKVLAPIRAAQLPHHVKLQRQRPLHPLKPRSARHNLPRKPIDRLARVVQHSQKLMQFLRRHLGPHHLLDELPQPPRRVVDHVPQLRVFAMNVADHMHDAHRQRERRFERRNLRDRILRAGKLSRQRLQVCIPIRGK